MEQKRFDKRNWIVIGVVIVLIIAAGAVAMWQRHQLAAAPAETSAYLVVTVAGETYMPIKLEEPGKYTITRGDMVNEIEVGKGSVKMHASTCDNQDCVLQGEVTLENRADRVLQNMILCLPHEVILELLTEEETRKAYPNAFVTEAADE